jgi:hypothetical protein
MNDKMHKSKLTRIALPVKVVLGVAGALEIEALLLARGAVSEGNVEVGDIVEEVNLALVEQQTRSDGMDGGITPTLVEETTVLIKGLEEIDVSRAAEPFQTANLEVGPL